MTQTAVTERTTQKPLPAGWRWVRLGDVCVEQTGTRDPRSEPNNSFWYVDISSVNNLQKRIESARQLCGRDAPSRARQVIRTNDVIVATTRPNLNAVALVPKSLDNQICSTGFCVLRPTRDLDYHFLFSYVRSPNLIYALSELVKGALYPAVSDRQVRDTLIPLPPLAEQGGIAAILTGQMAVIERARVAAEAQLEAAKVLPASYLRSIFDTNEAQKWSLVALREICLGDGQYGTSEKGNFDGIGSPVLGMANLVEGRIAWGNLRFIEQSESEKEKYLLKKGDLLFNRTNSAELVGKTAVFDDSRDAVFASYLIRFRIAPEKADPKFVSAYMTSAYGRRFINQHMARAIGQVNISASVMHRMPIPLPPLAKQKRIAAELAERMTSVEHTQIAAEAELTEINLLPSALLRRAFSGELLDAT